MIIDPIAEVDERAYVIRQIKLWKDEIAELEAKIQSMREEWGEKIMASGNFTCSVGRIELRRASQSVTYDSLVVQTIQAVLEESHPYLAAQLEGAKKITFRGETWSVK